MSEGRRSKLSSASILHQSTSKRTCDGEDEGERNSPKRFHSDVVGFGYLGDGEETPVVADAPVKKVPGKRGRKKKSHLNPVWLHERRGGSESPSGEGSTSSATTQPSSSGSSLVQAPCHTPEKHVHFLPESVAEDMDVVTRSPRSEGTSSKDQGVQVKLGDVAAPGVASTSVSNRSVQTAESVWNVRGAVPSDAQGGRKPVDLVPEARSNKMASGSHQALRKEPEASDSMTSGLLGAKQPEAGGDGGEMVDAGRPQGCEARRGATRARTMRMRTEEYWANIFEDHYHVHLELAIELLILCLVMWFFKYR